MRKTFKNEKGITLATLTLTIIVLLILSSVVINYSLESIDHSKYMAMYTEMQVIQEKVNLYYSEGKDLVGTALNNEHKEILQYKVGSSVNYNDYYYFPANILSQKLEIDSIEGDYLISVKNRDVIGLTVIKNQGMGYVNYRWEDISDGFNVEYSEPIIKVKLSQKAKIGDLVDYDPTSGGNASSANTSYTSRAGTASTSGNGSGNQTFSAQNYVNNGGKWRILNIEGDTVTLISDLIYQDSGTVMGTTGLTLSNGVGYLWAEQEIHKICSIYGHGEGADTTQTITYYYGGPHDQDGSITSGTVEAQQGRKTTIDLDSGARGITIEDINKICSVSETYTENYSDRTVPKTAKIATYYPTIATTNASTGKSDAQESSSYTGENYYNTYYEYYITSKTGDTANQTSQKNLVKSETRYWLASRCVYSETISTDFGIRYAGWGGVFNYNACYCSGGEWYPSTPVNAVRALVTLDSEVLTSEYNSEKGWNLHTN